MRFALTSLIALLVFPQAPLAQEGQMVDVNGTQARQVACYEDVMMPAKVLVEHELVTPERRQYVKRRNGIVELVEYPAVYREKRTMLEAPYRELRQVPCKKKSIFSFLGF